MESLLCASHCQPLPLFCPRAFRLVMNIWRGLCNSISPHFFAPSEWFEFTAELFALRPSKSHLWKPSSVIILYKKSSFQLPQFSPAGLFNPDRCVLLLHRPLFSTISPQENPSSPSPHHSSLKSGWRPLGFHPPSSFLRSEDCRLDDGGDQPTASFTLHRTVSNSVL